MCIDPYSSYIYGNPCLLNICFLFLFLQVKKIMNNVYRGLREEFDADESYTGSEILAIILTAIKVFI